MFIVQDNIDLQNDSKVNKSILTFFANKQNLLEPYFFNSKNFVGVIKIPPAQERKTYAELPGNNSEDQRKIIELFTIMGSHGKMDLLINYKKHLEKLGKEIEHVHPLKLLGIIFSKPQMKQYLDNIYNDYFKWKSFIEGLEPNMNHEYLKNNMMQHIDDFAKEVNVPKENLLPFFQKRDWKGLVKFLIYN